MTAYTDLRAEDGVDLGSLSAIAELALELGAEDGSGDVRNAVIAELRNAGTAAVPAARRIGERETVNEGTRAKAWAILAARGDGEARARLERVAGSGNAEVRAEALSVLDPVRERARLWEALEHAAPGVRRAAISRLAWLSHDGEIRLRLAEVARIDPDPAVRAAAARGLAGFGAAAVEALRDRLSDPEGVVRLAVIGAIARADREAAYAILGAMLAGPPHEASIEAARWLADGSATGHSQISEIVNARLFLFAALEAGDDALRGQAAVAIGSLAASVPALDAELHGRLLERLSEERAPRVRLVLAEALGSSSSSSHRDASRAALVELGAGTGVLALQASARLASLGDPEAIARLGRVLGEGDARWRCVAVRGLGFEAMRPDDVAEVLADDDTRVRVCAAGAILSAMSARR